MLQRITLNVTDIHLNDDGDYLRLYDGGDTQAPWLANVTQDDVGNMYNSSGTQLTLQMVSNENGTSSGFLAHWTTYSKALLEWVDTTSVDQVMTFPLSHCYDYTDHTPYIKCIEPVYGVNYCMEININCLYILRHYFSPAIFCIILISYIITIQSRDCLTMVSDHISCMIYNVYMCVCTCLQIMTTVLTCVKMGQLVLMELMIIHATVPVPT